MRASVCCSFLLFVFGCTQAQSCYGTHPLTNVTFFCTGGVTHQNMYDGDNYNGLWMESTARCLSKYHSILPGACGCPNNCFSDFGHGSCSNSTAGSGCACERGWKGTDCSVVSCEEDFNPCQNGGSCVNKGGFDVCECADGFHSMDCSAKIRPITPIPQVIPGKQYVKDKYEDDHPLLDMSTITQIRINMSSDSLEKIITGPKGTEEMMTSLLIYNHKMESIQTNATISRSGHISAGFAKKSFRIHFEDETKGQKSIKLKGAQFDTSFQREASAVVVARSMNVPIYRMGYAALYINDIFHGVYVISEDMKKQMLKSRFGNKDGTSCKIKECEPFSAGMSDLLKFCKSGMYGNITAVEETMDVQSYIKSVAIDSMTGNFDGWIVNNNYLLYNDTSSNKVIAFRQDMDGSYGFLWPMAKRGIVDWFTYSRTCDVIPRQVKYVKDYSGYIDLMTTLMAPGGPIENMMTEMHEFILPLGVQDLWHELDYDFTPQRFVDSVAVNVDAPVSSMSLLNFVRERYTDAVAAVEAGRAK